MTSPVLKTYDAETRNVEKIKPKSDLTNIGASMARELEQIAGRGFRAYAQYIIYYE